MARETVFRCDKCGSTDDVRTWRLSNDSSWEVDLCAKDAKPILALAKLGREVGTAGTGRHDPNQTYDRMVRGVENGQ